MMIRLFRYLLCGDGHAHNWETIKFVKLVDDNDEYVADEYTLRCKRCGEIKSKVV